MNQFKDFEDVRNVFLSLPFFGPVDIMIRSAVMRFQIRKTMNTFLEFAAKISERHSHGIKWPVKCNVRAHSFGAAFMAPVPALRGGETFGVR